MAQDKSYIWNSIELFDKYKEHGGTLLTRKHLIQFLQRHFNEELFVLNCPGYASLLIFRKSKTPYLKLVKDDEGDNLDSCITVVAKQISKEKTDILLEKTKNILDF